MIDLNAQIDDYCERLGTGFWAEPLNAISNLGFIWAAWLIAQHLKKLSPDHQKQLRWLPINIYFIGFGSGLFHTVATAWSKAADVLPITFFIIAIVIYWYRKLAKITWPRTLMRLVGLGLLILFSNILFKDPIWNQSQHYLGIAVFFWLMAWDPASPKGTSHLWPAALAFTLSIIWRTIDLHLCNIFSYGTHFLWHINISLCCYLTGMAIMPKSRLKS